MFVCVCMCTCVHTFISLETRLAWGKSRSWFYIIILAFVCSHHWFDSKLSKKKTFLGQQSDGFPKQLTSTTTYVFFPLAFEVDQI